MDATAANAQHPAHTPVVVGMAAGLSARDNSGVTGGTVPRNAPVRTLPPGIGDELALRAALDPAWDAVLRAWIDGHDRYPQPFVNRPALPFRPA